MSDTTLTDDDAASQTDASVVLGLTLVYSGGLARAGEQVRLSGRSAVVLGRDEPLFPGGALGDPRMSSRHAALVRDGERWIIADRSSKNGTFVNGQRATEQPLEPGDVVRLGSTFIVFGRVPKGEPHGLALGHLVGVGAAMAAVRDGLALVAQTNHTVLLLGESGTGKEVAAEALHAASLRSGPFLAVNCASLRGELLESELFGHVRGAFTGALRAHDGLFVRADRGTLFLDELAEADEATQARLLRVLETRRVRPVGGSEESPVATRVVAATNRDIEQAVRDGRLRADLYARIARWTITLPRLAERREDLGVLSRALLARLASGPGLPLEPTPELMAALCAAPWPLNVRGLENVLTAAHLGQPVVRELELAPRVSAMLEAHASLAASSVAAPRPRSDADAGAPREVDAEGLKALLAEQRGNLAAVARALGLTRQSLYRLLERWAIDPEDFRPGGS